MRFLSIFILLIFARSISAQIDIPASETINVDSGGASSSADFYAQFTGGSFDGYGLAEFSISQADFGGVEVSDISLLTLTLTVNDRGFSQAGGFSVLFTPDSAADLSDYAGLAFDSGSTYGINLADFPTDPIVVGAGNYAFTGSTGGGTEVTVTLNLGLLKTALIEAINAGEPFHLLLATENTGSTGTVATFSGVDNTFDPGTPTLNITATTAGLAPEPSAYPSAFAANAAFNSISLSWTDSPDAVGYLVQISETNSFSAVADGTTPAEDLDLADGSGQAVAVQGTEQLSFDGLEEQTEYFFRILPYSNLGTDADYKVDGTPPTATATTQSLPIGDILITQYYEGSSSNKYLELTNVSSEELDLTGLNLTAWSNEATEDWKTGASTTTRVTPLDGIVMPAGSTIVVANGDATAPILPTDAAIPGTGSITSVEATFFNGNDSVVLYAGASQDPSTILDAIAFTDSGNEGANTSFTRLSTSAGYDLVSGSNVTDFPAVWGEITTATVDGASPGDDEYLGSSDLGAPPPSISFVDSSLLISEDGGTVDLTVRLLNPDGNEVEVDVVFSAGSSSADLADISSYSTQTLTFPDTASSGDTQTVTITISDDGDEESSETAVFLLENLVSSGLAFIGSASQANLTIQDDDTPIPNLYFSEVADPSDDASGRFVEIYNPTASPVDLGAGNWNLELYYNANASSDLTVALTGEIPAGGTYIVGQASFEGIYGFAPGDIGNVNFNGDDNLELRFGGDASTGVLVDVYGQPGTDGTGLSWDFADSRAVRLDSVSSGRSSFDAAEWLIAGTDVASATPGQHPETFVLPPTGVTATAQSDTTISVAFTAVGGNDVIVVFSAMDSFSAPGGSVPGVGDPFAGGTVLSVGTSSPVLQSGLTASTEYFYALYSTDGTDFSSAATTSATTDAVAGFIGEEDFEGTPGWVNQTAAGGDSLFGWQVINGEAIADGFDGPAAQVHYLVSPALNFSSASNPVIEFDYGEAYNGPALDLQYSTDYSGSGVPTEGGDTWTSTGFVFEEDLVNADTDFSSFSAQAELPASLEGESTVYLAFRYTADGLESGSRQWFIDNIIVRSLPAQADPLGDFLAGFGLTTADLDSDSGDNDGIPVIIEYLVDGDPTAPTKIQLGGSLMEVAPGDSRLTLQFISSRDDEPQGITIRLIGSNDLGIADPFVPISFEYLVPTDNGNGTFTHRYRQIDPIGDPDAKSFIQLEVLPSE